MGILKSKITYPKYFAIGTLSFIVLIGVWFFLTRDEFVRHQFLPPPAEVLKNAWSLFNEYDFLQDIIISVYRILIGFVFSVGLGVPIGILIGVNKYAEALFEPLIDFIRYMPVAGFVPLSILWLGLGDTQKATIIFIGTFFQLFPLVASAAASVPKEYIDISRTLGASDNYVILHVIIPYLMPKIYDSLRISFGIAWTYLIVAEIVAAGSGIGHVIIEAQRYLKTSHIFIGICVVGLLGLITDYLFKVFKPILFPWEKQTT